VPGDTNQVADVFVHDFQTGQTTLESVDSAGVEGSGAAPSLSADGRYVAFESGGAGLVPGDTYGYIDIFVHDRTGGSTTRVSVDSAGAQANSGSGQPSISADGRCVAFHSDASNLVPGDTNMKQDVFVHDRQTGQTTRVSVSSAGVQANYGGRECTLSADGRYVVFETNSTNLVSGDTNLRWDIFVRDRQTNQTTRVSVSSAGIQGNSESLRSTISADGRCVAFDSLATNFAANDMNNSPDVFVHDRNASGFASLCSPGLDGVIDCPCNNPPASSGRGCDNSSATGGATLFASGFAYLSLDSLAFTTSGERPSATSILLQGDALLAGGVAYGQGVRCAGGTLARLYVKSALNGGITAPDLLAGDLAVSARSAQLGMPIQPGRPYGYLVYYRDPLVSGGCAALATFNATQSGSISWWP
jgi:WD40-like Beta Propeller Repeat